MSREVAVDPGCPRTRCRTRWVRLTASRSNTCQEIDVIDLVLLGEARLPDPSQAALAVHSNVHSHSGRVAWGEHLFHRSRPELEWARSASQAVAGSLRCRGNVRLPARTEPRELPNSALSNVSEPFPARVGGPCRFLQEAGCCVPSTGPSP